jgi:hypothetical protein
MERKERIKLLAAKIGAKNHLGRTLISILRQAVEGLLVEATDALQLAINRSSQGELEANFALLLAASFAVLRPEIAGGLLARKFCPDCDVVVRTKIDIAEHFLILVEKIRHNEINLTFSAALARHSDLENQMEWLCWVMPLLSRVAGSSKVPKGMAFLNQWDAGIVPGLAYCANASGFFLIPDGNAFIPTQGYRELKRELAESTVEWTRRLPIAFWRGSTTGAVIDSSRGWRSLQRIALCELSQRHSKFIDAGLSSVTQWSGKAATEIESSGLIKDYFPANKLQRYRYLIDIDGNSNAWGGFFKRLLTGSPVLKIASPRGYRQWYYDRLRPWHNFVPVSADMSDLVAKIEWLIQHDTEAKKIGANGRALAYSIEYEAELDSALDTISAAFRSSSAARSATVNSATRQRTISTCHGTILAYNPESKALVHVAPELIFANLPLYIEEIGANIHLRTSSGEYIVDIGTEGSAKTRINSTPGHIRAEKKNEGEATFFMFKINDKFMCAETDGRITVTRKAGSYWESFRVNTGFLAGE